MAAKNLGTTYNASILLSVLIAISLTSQVTGSTSKINQNEQFTERTMKSNKNTEIGENWPTAHSQQKRDTASDVHSRQKRAFTPTQDEIQFYLDIHNGRRRLEGASNMEFLVSGKNI